MVIIYILPENYCDLHISFILIFTGALSSSVRQQCVVCSSFVWLLLIGSQGQSSLPGSFPGSVLELCVV